MINSLLTTFLSKHDPDADIVNQASDSQERLREVLASKLEKDSSLPFVLEGEDFLFGSAIRGTKPAPFDDIDLLLVLDGSTLNALEAGQNVGQAYGSGMNYNPLTLSKYLDENNLISSQKVLNQIRVVLDETYSRSEIRKDGQAINIWLDSYGFGVDVVPAIKINHTHYGPHYFIPQGGGSHMWMSTNPLSDLVAFKTEDERMGGLLTSACRIMRKWNELSNGKRLSGFHVDTLVFKALNCKNITTLENAVRECFNCFDQLLSESCPQFSGFYPNIDHKLSSDNRSLTRGKIQEAVNYLKPQYGALPVSSSYSIRAWNAIFNGELIK